MLQKNRVSSTKIHLQINTSVDKINYGNSDRNNWISLGKREKYSHDPCAVSWGDSLIPMHLQYVQAINMSNTFHMFTITKSCNVSLEDLRWKFQCVLKLGSSEVLEVWGRGSSSRPLAAVLGQADRVLRFFFSCSLRFPGLPFFFFPGVLSGCSLYVSTLLVSWVRYLPSSSDPNRTGWFLVLGAGLELGDTSEVALISAVWISAIRWWRKKRRRKSWMDLPLSCSSWCSDTARLSLRPSPSTERPREGTE